MSDTSKLYKIYVKSVDPGGWLSCQLVTEAALNSLIS